MTTGLLVGIDSPSTSLMMPAADTAMSCKSESTSHIHTPSHTPRATHRMYMPSDSCSDPDHTCSATAAGDFVTRRAPIAEMQAGGVEISPPRAVASRGPPAEPAPKIGATPEPLPEPAPMIGALSESLPEPAPTTGAPPEHLRPGPFCGAPPLALEPRPLSPETTLGASVPSPTEHSTRAALRALPSVPRALRALPSVPPGEPVTATSATHPSARTPPPPGQSASTPLYMLTRSLGRPCDL